MRIAPRKPAKPAKLAVNATLRRYVQERLAGMVIAAARYGPQACGAGRGAGTGGGTAGGGPGRGAPSKLPGASRATPEDDSMRISHEAIYQALYVQGRGALRRELTACLRTGRALRVPRARTRARGSPSSRPSS